MALLFAFLLLAQPIGCQDFYDYTFTVYVEIYETSTALDPTQRAELAGYYRFMMSHANAARRLEVPAACQFVHDAWVDFLGGQAAWTKAIMEASKAELNFLEAMSEAGGFPD